MEELFGSLISEFVVGAVFIAVGFCYLYLRYRQRLKVKRVLLKKYENSYLNAGQDVVLKLVAAVGILLVLALICAPFLHWLKF